MVVDAQDCIEHSSHECNDEPDNGAENDDNNNNNEVVANAARDPQERLQDLINTMAEVSRDYEQVESNFQTGIGQIESSVGDGHQEDIERDLHDLGVDDDAFINDDGFDEAFHELNNQLDNLNTFLNQLEGKSDQLLSNLQALLQDIRK